MYISINQEYNQSKLGGIQMTKYQKIKLLDSCQTDLDRTKQLVYEVKMNIVEKLNGISGFFIFKNVVPKMIDQFNVQRLDYLNWINNSAQHYLCRDIDRQDAVVLNSMSDDFQQMSIYEKMINLYKFRCLTGKQFEDNEKIVKLAPVKATRYDDYTENVLIDNRALKIINDNHQDATQGIAYLFGTYDQTFAQLGIKYQAILIDGQWKINTWADHQSILQTAVEIQSHNHGDLSDNTESEKSSKLIEQLIGEPDTRQRKPFRLSKTAKAEHLRYGDQTYRLDSLAHNPEPDDQIAARKKAEQKAKKKAKKIAQQKKSKNQKSVQVNSISQKQQKTKNNSKNAISMAIDQAEQDYQGHVLDVDNNIINELQEILADAINHAAARISQLKPIAKVREEHKEKLEAKNAKLGKSRDIVTEKDSNSNLRIKYSSYKVLDRKDLIAYFERNRRKLIRRPIINQQVVDNKIRQAMISDYLMNYQGQTHISSALATNIQWYPTMLILKSFGITQQEFNGSESSFSRIKDNDLYINVDRPAIIFDDNLSIKNQPTTMITGTFNVFVRSQNDTALSHIRSSFEIRHNHEEVVKVILMFDDSPVNVMMTTARKASLGRSERQLKIMGQRLNGRLHQKRQVTLVASSILSSALRVKSLQALPNYLSEDLSKQESKKLTAILADDLKILIKRICYNCLFREYPVRHSGTRIKLISHASAKSYQLATGNQPKSILINHDIQITPSSVSGTGRLRLATTYASQADIGSKTKIADIPIKFRFAYLNNITRCSLEFGDIDDTVSISIKKNHIGKRPSAFTRSLINYPSIYYQSNRKKFAETVEKVIKQSK